MTVILQESAFSEEKYQKLRSQLVEICHGQVQELNQDLVSVKLKKQFVEKYRKEEAFSCLSESDKGELLKEIAPLVTLQDTDESAKRFDNFMYGMMLAHMESMSGFRYAKKQLCETAVLLEKKANIPQIKEKLPLIKQINTDGFWDANDILLFEEVRDQLRGLMKFLDDAVKKPVFTNISDVILEQSEGILLDSAYNFEDYRKKVNRYVEEHKNTMAIHKLTHNIPLAPGDYTELERIFTVELGSREDYEREFGDTPFGLLIRKIAKLDHDAAMEAFSEFINDEALNQKQIAFIHKIINHIEQIGYMENVMELQKPPFDKPVPFFKMFSGKTRNSLLKAINSIKDNAVNIIAG